MSLAAGGKVTAAREVPGAVGAVRVGGCEPRPPFGVFFRVHELVEVENRLIAVKRLPGDGGVIRLGPDVDAVDAASAGQEHDDDVDGLMPGCGHAEAVQVSLCPVLDAGAVLPVLGDLAGGF